MIFNETKNTILAPKEERAFAFLKRLKGLLGTNDFPPGGALVIKPCSSIHTFGMNYLIDVLFVDDNHRVLKVVSQIRPGKIAACKASKYVIELPPGMAAKTNTETGDYLHYN